MTLPTTCTPARRAVVHALTTVTGMPRALASDQLFRLLPPAQAAANPADVKRKPGVFVVFADAAVDPEMENGSVMTIHHSVVITCTYYMGSDPMAAEVDRQLERMEADGNRLRAALCYPGALATYDGADTGLCGGALRSDGYRAQGPTPMPVTPESEDRLMRVVHYLRASIDTLQPT